MTIATHEDFVNLLREARNVEDGIWLVIESIPNDFARGYMSAAQSRYNGVLDGEDLIESLISDSSHLTFSK